MKFEDVNEVMKYVVSKANVSALAEVTDLSPQYLSGFCTGRIQRDKITRSEQTAIRVCRAMGFDLEIKKEYVIKPIDRQG